MTDRVLFGIFPYIALLNAVVVTLYRYFSNRFSFSSYSSQFFESKALFFGSIPWHYGILIIPTYLESFSGIL
jgi:nitrate reductase gamma subunit